MALIDLKKAASCLEIKMNEDGEVVIIQKFNSDMEGFIDVALYSPILADEALKIFSSLLEDLKEIQLKKNKNKERLDHETIH